MSPYGIQPSSQKGETLELRRRIGRLLVELRRRYPERVRRDLPGKWLPGTYITIALDEVIWVGDHLDMASGWLCESIVKKLTRVLARLESLT